MLLRPYTFHRGYKLNGPQRPSKGRPVLWPALSGSHLTHGRGHMSWAITVTGRVKNRYFHEAAWMWERPKNKR